MTPIDKAKELAMKFDKYGETDNAKQCALIAVDEILKIHSVTISYHTVIYWQEVKQEIEKL
jgi:hypothetical protein